MAIERFRKLLERVQPPKYQEIPWKNKQGDKGFFIKEVENNEKGVKYYISQGKTKTRKKERRGFFLTVEKSKTRSFNIWQCTGTELQKTLSPIEFTALPRVFKGIKREKNPVLIIDYGRQKIFIRPIVHNFAYISVVDSEALKLNPNHKPDVMRMFSLDGTGEIVITSTPEDVSCLEVRASFG